MPADLTLRPTLLGLPDIPQEDERELLMRLIAKQRRETNPLIKLNNYYNGEQRLQHLGMAIPPALRIFETVVGVPAVAVDEVVKRQELRGFYRRGNSVTEDPDLREAADYNNLGSQAVMLQTDTREYGRGFVSVGSNADEPDQPRIVVESPMNMTVAVDQPRRMIRAGVRCYIDEAYGTKQATLLTPNATSHWKVGSGGWVPDDSQAEDARDDHGFGVVPLVMFINKQRSGSFDGRSEMAPVITKTDAIARIVTNMQVGAETHALPHYWAAGMTMADFIDPKTKKQLPKWESYFNAIWATANKEARFGQFAASDLSNFYNAVDKMLSWCAFELGLPVSYVGQTTTNPATEGAIIADEIRLIRNVELKNRFDGDSWVWVMGLRDRFLERDSATNDIRAVYFNPATPTFSQRADAVTKLRATKDISRRGMWDELGWDTDKQDLELARLRDEAAEEQQQDQLLQTIAKGFAARQASAGGGQQTTVVDATPARQQLNPATAVGGTA
jgi:hypothetical protein